MSSIFSFLCVLLSPCDCIHCPSPLLTQEWENTMRGELISPLPSEVIFWKHWVQFADFIIERIQSEPQSLTSLFTQLNISGHLFKQNNLLLQCRLCFGIHNFLPKEAHFLLWFLKKNQFSKNRSDLNKSTFLKEPVEIVT